MSNSVVCSNSQRKIANKKEISDFQKKSRLNDFKNFFLRKFTYFGNLKEFSILQFHFMDITRVSFLRKCRTTTNCSK